MPCRVDPIYVNHKKENKELVEIADTLTHFLDVAREDILAGRRVDFTPVMGLHERVIEIKRLSNPLPPVEGTPLNEKLLGQVEKLLREKHEYVQASLMGGKYDLELVSFRQEKHRREDIKRLRKVFADAEDEAALANTMKIDYTRPLAPQLGYDPDEY